MGALCDRFGGRIVVVIASVLYCAGLYLTATGNTIGPYFGGGLLIGLAVAGTSHGVLVGIVSRLATPAVRATAISILAAVGSLGTFVIAGRADDDRRLVLAVLHGRVGAACRVDGSGDAAGTTSSSEANAIKTSFSANGTG